MDKTCTHTHGIKWIIKEWKWNHMDNFTKFYGTKWTNDTYIEAQCNIKESIWKHMDNVNKLYGTKWTNDHTWMQSGLQKNPYGNIWTKSKNFMESNGPLWILMEQNGHYQ